MRTSSDTDCHQLTSGTVGMLPCACSYVVVTAGLSKAKYLAYWAPVLLLCTSLVWWAAPGCIFLSVPPSSSLSLIVSIWIERLPLSVVLMGCFHRGLGLEWIDRRRYPCSGKFASCVPAHCCCSSSYSSSSQGTGKSWSQLCSPLLGPAAQPHARSSCVWPFMRLSVSLHRLHHPMKVFPYLAHQVVFYCAALWSRIWVITASCGMLAVAERSFLTVTCSPGG